MPDITTLKRDIVNATMEATDAESLERILAACRAKPRPQRIGNARQAAEILGTCPRTVFRYAAAGRLKIIRQSARRLRFDLDAVSRLATEGVQS